jgi:hypothetical protein
MISNISKLAYMISQRSVRYSEIPFLQISNGVEQCKLNSAEENPKVKGKVFPSTGLGGP